MANKRDYIDNTCGNRIRELRLEKKMTQEEFADAIGINRSAIAKYERGIVTNLKQDTILKLAKFFDVSPAYFFGGERQLNTTKPELIKMIDSMTIEQQEALLTIAKAMVK